MSYHQQLRSVFNEPEIKILVQLTDEHTGADFLSSMTNVEKRLLQSIRDKLTDKEQIRQSKTTQPNKL